MRSRGAFLLFSKPTFPKKSEFQRPKVVLKYQIQKILTDASDTLET